MVNMTDEAVNDRIKELPIIKQLEHQDKKTIEELEGLKFGQVGMNERLDGVDSRLEKGDIRMGKIEETLHNEFFKLTNLVTSVREEVKDEKNKDLKAYIKELKDDKKEIKTRVFDIFKLFMAATLSIGVGAFLAYLALGK